METQNPKQQAVDRIKLCNNVLVTVSTNPSVDQLASAIGFALLLNKLGKHASAVFSGEVPSTIEFLEPEKNIEKNTDSLRDFIIALDKSKADKLRYKVEDQHVKIFITPYKTSISQSDLKFSQGDFNVDAVVAIGVQKKDEIDQAITAHGRILHDATVITVNNTGSADLGAINWTDTGASSLCEMLVSLGEDLKEGELLDEQIATAFLTGIVAETQRFSNEKTSSTTMSLSAKLMSAGANQQLVATKLDQLPTTPDKRRDQPQFDAHKMDELANEVSVIHEESRADNDLEIAQDKSSATSTNDSTSSPPKMTETVGSSDSDQPMSLNRIEEMVHSPHLQDYMPQNDDEKPHEQIHIDEHGTLRSHDEHQKHLASQPNTAQPTQPSDLSTQNNMLQPQHDNLLLESSDENHNATPEPMVNPLLDEDKFAALPEPLPSPSLDDMLAASSSAPSDEPTNSLSATEPMQPQPDVQINSRNDIPLPELPSLDQSNQTRLTADLDQHNNGEQNDSPLPEAAADNSSVDAARNAVEAAMEEVGENKVSTTESLTPMDLNLGPDPASSPNSMSQFGSPQQLNLPSNLIPTTPPTDTTASPVSDPTAPPPVPPPMIPPNFGSQ